VRVPLAVLCGLVLAARAGAQEGGSYVYSIWKRAVPTPPAYLCVDTIDGRDLGVGDLHGPEDLFVSEDGDIFIADTQNDRIIRTSADWRVLQVYTTFDSGGVEDAFDQPGGIFATGDRLYVADTHHRRIVVLDGRGGLAALVGEPTSDIIRSEYRYLPSRIVVDAAGRMYVVGPGMFEGIMEFDQEGTFAGFLGANRVHPGLADYLWRVLSTREQRTGLVLFMPEEFSNLDIDPQGFIYSTTRDEDAEHPVKKHNAEGLDVLKRQGFFPPVGDVDVNNVGTIKGPSSFVDVAIERDGMYHCLDAKRGRVFTYDEDGSLLSVFGGFGDRQGTFRDPVSLETLDGRILVLDKTLGTIAVFEPTEYGRLLREAVARYRNGDDEAARLLWERVLDRNANLDIGYSGIGKIELRRGDARQAMREFRLGSDRPYYSRAFTRYRKEVLHRAGPLVLTFLVTAAAALWILRRVRRRRRTRTQRTSASPGVTFRRRLSFAFTVMQRPFDGFWDLKHEGIGSPASALVVLGATVAAVCVKTRFSGFLFTTVNTADYRVGQDVLRVVLPVTLFCLGNWSLTSLMDGEGSFRDIFVSTAYALAPIALIFPVLTACSYALALEEGAVTSGLELLAYLWTGFLVFAGNKTVHSYSVRKTLGMLFLTAVAAGVILFLALISVSFVEQLASFLSSTYRELLFRR